MTTPSKASARMTPTDAPEPTPLTLAMRAIEDTIRRSVMVEPDRIILGQVGQPFAATSLDIARAAAEALLAGDWLERVLAEHRGPRRRLLVGGVPDWICDDCLVSIARANESVDRAMARHQAAAVRAAAGVGL